MSILKTISARCRSIVAVRVRPTSSPNSHTRVEERTARSQSLAIRVQTRQESLPSSLSTDSHLSKHRTNSLMLYDGDSESLAIVCVLCRFDQAALSESDGTGSDERSSDIESTHCDLESRARSVRERSEGGRSLKTYLETISGFTENVLFRDHDILCSRRSLAYQLHPRSCEIA